MSYEKEYHARIGRMVKKIILCCVEQVKSILIDMNASKGISEEVAKSFDISIIQIGTYRFDRERTLLIGQTTDSDGGCWKIGRGIHMWTPSTPYYYPQIERSTCRSGCITAGPLVHEAPYIITRYS